MLASDRFCLFFLTVEKEEDSKKIAELYHHGDRPVGLRQVDVH